MPNGNIVKLDSSQVGKTTFLLMNTSPTCSILIPVLWSRQLNCVNSQENKLPLLCSAHLTLASKISHSLKSKVFQIVFFFSLKKRAKLQFVVIEKKAVGLQPLVAV